MADHARRLDTVRDRVYSLVVNARPRFSDPRIGGKSMNPLGYSCWSGGGTLASSSRANGAITAWGSVHAMGSPTPEQAVIHELSRPPGTITALAEPRRGVPTPTVVAGGLGFVADLDKLRFVKHRQAGERARLRV